MKTLLCALGASMALGGCVPPASLFMMSDGRVASLGEHDLTGGVGANGLFVAPSEPGEKAGVGGPQLGGDVSYAGGLGRGVALRVGAGIATGSWGDGHVDVEVRLVKDPDAPFQAMFTGGIVGYGSITPLSVGAVGLRAGTVLSGAPAERVRLYGGLRVDTTWTAFLLSTPNAEFDPEGEPDEGDRKLPPIPSVGLNGAVGAAFDLSKGTTLGLELAATPRVNTPVFGTMGGALWFRARFGRPKEQPAE